MSFRAGLLSALIFISTSLSFSLYAASNSKSEQAVAHAQQYRGTTLNVVWNKGLMSKEVLLYSGPLWEQLTGIKINVIELAIPEVYPSVEKEHFKRSGSYDIISIVPNRLPDYINLDALEPLDAFLDQYQYRNDLDDITPAFRDNWMSVNGQIYSIPDDGDVLLLYYRKDLFEDPKNKAAFLKQYGYPLAPPKTWHEFDQISAFFSVTYAPQMYGSAFMHQELSHYFFSEQFRINGGVFFDAKTMQAKINSKEGLKTLEQMIARQSSMPPGVENWSFMDVLGAFIHGQLAMTEFWPPMGRWAEGYGKDSELLAWVPKSLVAGKVGYAPSPGGHGALAAGFGLSIASTSNNKDAAYLFIQWLSSREVSLNRVQTPYSLRDPYRISHYNSASYRNLWPSAGDYLDTLQKSTKNGLLDLSLLQINLYEKSLMEGLKAAFTRKIEPQQALDHIARQWNQITQSIGVEKQQHYYKEWMSKPLAYP
ncbi:multiple sugar transport system substrate-binding protein [Oceanospirillum multiglobuliferum]|uniref:ABC transporter substrate-binding protein n=1 Tax=Oceanospirillum multiglobuliferum TaxID=64969 RepID=A0A1T4PC67_9GAMM|nr:extracellular solute-binding protein [Oceanospirillum multiglobuliferum]OPX55621.1 hypothetical protein BTE48_08400 [Oceanospirillum multiglobuliferum]SJZ88796.1 multiple sugar transport system substrate-binding protein [Oceanospirillum multiglobuliferum]